MIVRAPSIRETNWLNLPGVSFDRRQRPGQITLTGYCNVLQPQPAGHIHQFRAELLGNLPGTDARLSVRRQHSQRALSTVGFDIDAGHQALAQEERQNIVSPAPFRQGYINLDPVLEPEQPLHSLAVPDERIER